MVLSPQMVAVWSWAVLGAACLHLHHHSAPAATTSTFTWNRTRGCALRGRRAQQDRTAAMYECCSLFFFYSWQRCSLLVHLRMQHGLCDAALDNLLLSTTGSKLSDCLQQTCSYQPCCKSNIPAPVGHPSCLSLSLCPPPQQNKVTWEQPRASQLNMVTNNRLYSQQHKAL